MEKFTEYIESADKIQYRLDELTNGKHINTKIATDFIEIAQGKYKRYLNELFFDLFPDLIKEDAYYRFVLFSYRSFFGEIPSQSINGNNNNKRRLNLFKKGKRWNDVTGDYFYSFLEKLNDRFGETPINLLGELCAKYKKRYIILKWNRSPFFNKNTLSIPHNTVLETNNDKAKMISGLLRRYISFLRNGPSRVDYSNLNKIEEIISHEYTRDEILKNSTNSKIILEFANAVKEFFGMSDDEFEEYKDRIIVSFYIYQFNDLPFDLHLIFPESDNFESVLMISLKEESTLDTNTINFLKEIVNRINYLGRFEKNVVDQSKTRNESYIIWRHLFENEYNRRISLMEIVKKICTTICQKKGIPVLQITGRVKAFESFYNKIFIRANNEITNHEFKRKYQITYKEAIDLPQLHYKKIFEFIKDIIGVRVVLLFEDDIQEIIEEFKNMDKADDLKIRDSNPYDQSNEENDIFYFGDTSDIYSYRSSHLVISPGYKRLSLIEYHDLIDTHCEIQFRTVLAHAWANVYHDYLYKNNEVIKELNPDEQNNLKEDLYDFSKTLSKNDKKLIEIKQKSKNLKTELDDNNNNH